MFYERMLVAKFIQEIFREHGNKYTLNECFYYVQTKGDAGSMDLIWFNTVGDYVTWENHLEDICFKALGIKRQQPGYSPFIVSRKIVNRDSKYKMWYEREWIPYINSLVTKYEHLWKPRLETKIGRGMVNVIDVIDERIKPVAMEFKDSNVFSY